MAGKPKMEPHAVYNPEREARDTYEELLRVYKVRSTALQVLVHLSETLRVMLDAIGQGSLCVRALEKYLVAVDAIREREAAAARAREFGETSPGK